MSSRQFVRIEPSVLATSNLVVTAPTGSGKTYNTLRSAWELVKQGRYGKVIVLAPTRSACEDIARTARSIAGEYNVGVDTSDARLEPGWKPDIVWSRPIVVTTYERADSVLLTNPELFRNAIVVIDEAHNIIYPERATAILDILANLKELEENGGNVRVVLLSATMPRINEFQNYLNANLVSLNTRPVELKIETIRTREWYGRGSTSYYLHKFDYVVDLLKKLNPREHAPILIYVPNKFMVEEYVKRLRAMAGNTIPWLRPEEVVGHHAGLPFNERKRIEEELKKPNPRYKIVVATDTLAQSVNMSFRTVIVPGLKLFLPSKVEPVQPATIRQVLGRAGRPGYSNTAYGFIIYTPDEEALVRKALEGVYDTNIDLGDYIALPLRLAMLGKDVDKWIRYAPPLVDVERLRSGKLTLEKLKLLEEGRPTPLGYVLAKEYVPSQAFPFIILLRDEEYVKGFRNPEELSLVGSLGLGYLLQKLWFQEKTIKQRLFEKGAPEPTINVNVLPTLEEAWRRVENLGITEGVSRIGLAHNLKPEWMLTPDVKLVFEALWNPQAVSTDMLAEACRKGAQILSTLAQYGQLPREVAKYARTLMQIFKTYRKLLRVSPAEAEQFIRTVLKDYETLRTLAESGLSPEQVYIYMKGTGVDLETAIRKLQGLEKKSNNRNSRIVLA